MTDTKTTATAKPATATKQPEQPSREVQTRQNGDVQQTPQDQPAQQERPNMAQMLTRMMPEIQRSLPKHMSGDRFTRLVLTQMRKQPKLAQSTPESFFGALLTASAVGLEPGVNGEAYLVAYKDGNASRIAGYDVYECQFIAGYQGIAKLFYQHPLAKRLAAETVYERDHFRIGKGLAQVLEHEPAIGDRGAVVGYWALAELTTGAVNFDFFTPEQIRALRNGKVGTSGDIPDPERWMERKTALKQVLKLMPKSAQLVATIQADEQPGSLSRAEQITFTDTSTGEITSGGDL